MRLPGQGVILDEERPGVGTLPGIIEPLDQIDPASRSAARNHDGTADQQHGRAG
jgi:hypothetical protein